MLSDVAVALAQVMLGAEQLDVVHVIATTAPAVGHDVVVVETHRRPTDAAPAAVLGRDGYLHGLR
jgi:hypothetical protein